ncbi:MAG TPA: DUF72 domain-containing protein [Actinomycetota bacterium]|nr:DUF72 domain-containing protein [Actinomycetota bacterium]
MAGRLYLGTSGFAYDEWKGSFYPNGVRSEDFLSYYASRFPSVEINYTFRRNPAEKTLLAWREQTPEGFVFTLKANQRITHTLRLSDADEAVSFFVERARSLGDRLGPILFQCPPSLKHDRALIERFVGGLPPMAAAMEFRHPSWEEARGFLADMGVAWCVAETDEKAPQDLSWEPFGFLRLRKVEYTDDELKAWAEQIRPEIEAGRDVYCYFKHEEHGNAPAFAAGLVELVSS